MAIIDEIFIELKKSPQGHLDYSFHTSPPDDLNNIEAMHRFLEENDLTDYVFEDDETLVSLKHEKYDFIVFIESGGLGDFYSHEILIHR